MHRNSLIEMQKFRDNYLSGMNEATVLDVGSMQIMKTKKDTYRDIFEPDFNYTGMDVIPGENVDIVGYENIRGVYDIVISGQTMEHVKRPWDWLRFLKRYFKTYICIIVPNTHKEHRHPLDTYRYFPDGMRDLFEYVGIKEIEIYMSGNDTIGIGGNMNQSPGTGIDKVTFSKMSFGDAMKEALEGKYVRRLEWEDKNARLVIIDEKLMVYRSDDKKFHPLIVSSGDIAGDDWIITEEKDIIIN